MRQHFKRTFGGVVSRWWRSLLDYYWTMNRDVDLEERLRARFILCGIYVMLPLYALSRVINLLYPIVIFVHVYVGGLWAQISLLQYVFSSVYLWLLTMVVIAGYMALWQQYYIWHLLPGVERMEAIGQVHIDLMLTYYGEWTAVPMRKEVLATILGPDIAEIVNQFLPPSLRDLEMSAFELEREQVAARLRQTLPLCSHKQYCDLHHANPPSNNRANSTSKHGHLVQSGYGLGRQQIRSKYQLLQGCVGRL